MTTKHQNKILKNLINDIKNELNNELNNEVVNNEVVNKHNHYSSNNYLNNDDNTFENYISNINDLFDVRSLFISLILDIKDRKKTCATCITCSEIIKIIENYIKEYKKISSLALHLSNLMQFIIEKRKINKWSGTQQSILNLLIVIITKTSRFTDLEFICKYFTRYVNINIYGGLIIKIAIQKFNNDNIKQLLLWGADITLDTHVAIVEAFYYEKIDIVKTFINHGSSYKYYLIAELNDAEYNYILPLIEEIINTEYPNYNKLEKEHAFVDKIFNFAEIRRKNNKKYFQLEDDDFIYDFIKFLNIELKCIICSANNCIHQLNQHNDNNTLTHGNSNSNSISNSNSNKKSKKHKKKNKQINNTIHDTVNTGNDTVNTSNDTVNNTVNNKDILIEPVDKVNIVNVIIPQNANGNANANKPQNTVNNNKDTENVNRLKKMKKLKELRLNELKKDLILVNEFSSYLNDNFFKYYYNHFENAFNQYDKSNPFMVHANLNY